MRDHRHLLAPGRIGTLVLRNRIVMAPMGSNLAEDDGTPGPRLLAHYEARARGGVGLVVVELAGVAWPAGASNPRQLAVSDDRFVAPLATIVDRIHRHGAAAALQLHHGGKVATRDIVAGRPMWVPSIPPDDPTDLFRDLSAEDRDRALRDYLQPGAGVAHHVMTADDVAHAVGWFAAAAERARAAGFDAVELHAGHGYLLQSFLSPHTNRRDDDYGGTVEERARFLTETVAAVRDRVGPDFPVWCRLDGEERGVPDGIAPADARATARLAVAAGLDAVHVSAYANPGLGAMFTAAPLVHEPGGFVALAAAIRAEVDVPVIAVGRIDPDAADALVEAGTVDFVAMGRALLADPDLPRHLADGHPERIRPCIYAYRCVGNVFLNEGVRCVVNPSTGRDHELPGALEPAGSARRVLVIGAGPAGIELARVAAARGHHVTVAERRDAIGGALRAAALEEPATTDWLAWAERALARAGVDLRTGAADVAAVLVDVAPDVVVVATGADRSRRDIPGTHAAPVARLDDLDDLVELVAHSARTPPPRTVVVGGDAAGLRAAVVLAAAGAAVTVLEAGPHLGAGLAPPRLWLTLAVLRDRGVALHVDTPVVAIEPDAVRAGEPPRRVPADRVLIAGPPAPVPPLPLPAGPWEVHTIGDAAGPEGLEAAVLQAHRLGRRL